MKVDIAEQYDKIYRYCYFKLHNAHVAEDITQETFLRFLECEGYRDAGKPLAFLYTVARNLCIDEFRKKNTGRTAGRTGGGGFFRTGPAARFPAADIGGAYKGGTGAVAACLCQRGAKTDFGPHAWRFALPVVPQIKRNPGKMREGMVIREEERIEKD